MCRKNHVIKNIIVISLATLMISANAINFDAGSTEMVREVKVTGVEKQTKTMNQTVEAVEFEKTVKNASVGETGEGAKTEISLTEEEINLIALVTMAEAEGESEEGKRLVIDTILNRVESEHFPNTVSGVIYQRNQFTSMWNGRVDRCCVQDDICELVREEATSRTNHEVVFFTAGNYGKYGKPMFPVGNHYFCSYE